MGLYYPWVSGPLRVSWHFDDLDIHVLITQDICYTMLSGRICFVQSGRLHKVLTVNSNYTQEFSGNEFSNYTHICYTKELFWNCLYNHYWPHSTEKITELLKFLCPPKRNRENFDFLKLFLLFSLLCVFFFCFLDFSLNSVLFYILGAHMGSCKTWV